MLYKRLVHQKKAQVTLFVIIALILIAVLVLYFSFRPGIEQAPKVTEPQAYVEKCMKDSASEALNLISKQGGTVNPIGYAFYDGNKVGYLCYTGQYYMKCINQKPMLKYTIESQVTEYSYPKVQECISNLRRELIDMGYEVSIGTLNIATSLEPKKVIVTAAMPITIAKKETKTFNEFQAIILSPIYEQAMLAQNIVNSEIEYGDYDQLSYMLYNPETDIEKKSQGENTIYILNDRSTDKSFIFTVRSYVMPPGF